MKPRGNSMAPSETPRPEPSRLRLLSGLLALPGHESYTVLEEIAGELPWLRQSLPELTSLPLDRWQGEHTRLFINGFPRTPCPPFESAYREGLMSGSTGEELVTLYQRVGLEARDIPPDYLGALLELAAHLLERAEPLDDRLWTTLWNDHLGTWVPRFARDLINASHLSLYRRLGEELLALFPDHHDARTD